MDIGTDIGCCAPTAGARNLLSLTDDNQTELPLAAAMLENMSKTRV